MQVGLSAVISVFFFRGGIQEILQDARMGKTSV